MLVGASLLFYVKFESTHSFPTDGNANINPFMHALCIRVYVYLYLYILKARRSCGRRKTYLCIFIFIYILSERPRCPHALHKLSVFVYIRIYFLLVWCRLLCASCSSRSWVHPHGDRVCQGPVSMHDRAWRGTVSSRLVRFSVPFAMRSIPFQ